MENGGIPVRSGFAGGYRSSQLALRLLTSAVWAVILFVVLYPLWLILISSVSDPNAVLRGQVLAVPVDFSLVGYRAVLQYPLLSTGLINSMIYTLSGTALSTLITLACAYALTRRFPGKRGVLLLIVFPMLFSGGLIPIFLNIRSLHLYNTRAVMILMNLVSVWNLMVARAFIQQAIPDEIYDAASLDGADHITFFFRFVLPLSGAMAAVLGVYYGVARWNDYFTGLVMLRDESLFPLQLVLKDILAAYNAVGSSAAFFETYTGGQGGMQEALRLADAAKYCCIVLATAPPVLLFLAARRHFRNGIMVGAVKG